MAQEKESQEGADPAAGAANESFDSSGDLDESRFRLEAANLSQDLGETSDDEELSSFTDSALGASITGLEPIAAASSTEQEYKTRVFYQSLEHPRHFTNKLVEALVARHPELKEELMNGNDVVKSEIDFTHIYHQNVAKLLEEYFSTHDADIVVIGEYNDLRKVSGNENYEIVGRVGENDDGRRAMTVYRTTKRDIKGCRITTLDGEKIDMHFLDEEYKESRGIDPNASRDRLLPLSESAKNSIGQCIEVMIHNRYMLFVHRKETDKKGKKVKAEAQLLKLMSPTYIEKTGDGKDTIKYLIAGDLNAHVTTKQTNHDIHKDFTIMTFSANTDASNMSGYETSGLQKIINIPGKTASGKQCHDGIWESLMVSDRTKYKILGSLWALVKNSDGKYLILGDHKGFLLEIKVMHSGRDSPTRSFTPAANLVEDPQIVGAEIVPLGIGKKSATEASAGDEGIVSDTEEQECSSIYSDTHQGSVIIPPTNMCDIIGSTNGNFIDE